MKTVIMAGGKGERFWPRSRVNLPKQFLSLTDDGKTMIQSRTGGFQLFVNINRMIFACAKREESFCRVWVKKFIDADFLAHGNPSFLSFERDVNVLS